MRVRVLVEQVKVVLLLEMGRMKPRFGQAQCIHQLNTSFHPSIQQSAEVRPHVRHSFASIMLQKLSLNDKGVSVCGKRKQF